MLSKFGYISMDTSDKMTQFQMNMSFESLKEIAKEQKDAMEQSLNK